ncbi:hypothetical protein BaRGS_00020318, partial [Batillaria attramentaria]
GLHKTGQQGNKGMQQQVWAASNTEQARGRRIPAYGHVLVCPPHGNLYKVNTFTHYALE